MNPPQLDPVRLAVIVADGRAIDWDRLESSTGEHDRRLLRHFRVLGSLARAGVAPERSARRSLDDRLRGWLAPILWIAALRVAVSVVGYLAIGSQHTDAVPLEFQILAALAFVVSGAFLAYGGARDPRALDLAGFYLVVASSFTQRPLAELATQAGPGLRGLALALEAAPTDAFVALLLWMFVLRFPDLADYTAPQRVARAFLRASAALGVFLLLANLPLWPSAMARLPAAFDRDNVNGLFSITQLVLALAAVPVALWKARLAGVEERRRVSLFLLAFGAGVAPIMIASVLTLPVFGVREWLWAHRGDVSGVLFACLLTIPLSTAWAVRVHRVLEVRLLARRALRHAFASRSLAVLALAPLGLLALHLYRHRTETIAHALSGGTSLVLLGLALLSGLLWRLRERVVAALDALFSRSSEAPPAILARFGRALQSSRGPLAIARSLHGELARVYQPESAGVLILDRAARRFVALAGGLRTLEQEGALAQVLAEEPSPLRLDLEERGNLARLLPEAERQWLADGGVRLIAPLLDVAGALHGLVALGERRSELPYSDSDAALIAALTTAAAGALLREGEVAGSDADDAPASGEFPAHECTRCGLVASTEAPPCACGVALQPCLLPGLVRQKFALLARAGAGGMGVVYKARDLSLDRVVALKTLPKARAEFAARLRREARAMASLSHANLALIHGAESWRGVPFLVMEFLDGGTLRDRLKRGPLAAADAVALALALLDVLERLHGRGILHRDIKPSNIGFTAEGVPRLLDFGLARLVEDVESPTLDGTPLYMPFEAFSGEPPTPAWDLWGLAFVLYECLAGEHPRWRGAESVPLLETVPASDPRLSALLTRALAREPRARPASAAAFRRELLAIPVRS